jgi:hypothetical protein
VTLTLRFRQSDFPEFQQALADASHATLEAEIVESGVNIFPIVK